MKRYLPIIFLIIFYICIISLLVFGAEHSYTVGDLIPAKVIKVVDGDTIYVKIINSVYKVRLIGVNTPELEHKNLHIQEQPFGKAATEFTWKYLHDRHVWLELDNTWFDKYGRLLAYIWLKPFSTVSLQDLQQWQFNAILLSNGLAKVMRVRPNIKYHKAYLKIQKIAKKNKINIWR